jgi:hypothetical protein
VFGFKISNRKRIGQTDVPECCAFGKPLGKILLSFTVKFTMLVYACVQEHNKVNETHFKSKN